MKAGDELVFNGRPVRVTVVNADAGTVCVMYLDHVNLYGHGDREHDIPIPSLDGQDWACDFTEDPP